ncbi:sensor histidine kinase [Cystobacter fuscus]|uniref:sensor histidine kinase n=1 Tax=Cystobacter fuscus TaxID=43 RepID=UPI0022B75979|nr:ATP-binding protein [Cystobacter fuscus]
MGSLLFCILVYVGLGLALTRGWCEPEQLGVLSGLVGLSGGAALLAVVLVGVLAQVPPSTLFLQAFSSLALLWLALFGTRVYQRMIAAQREAHQSRLQALEQLAESERLRGRAEREASRAPASWARPRRACWSKPCTRRGVWPDAVEAAHPPRRAHITVSARREGQAVCLRVEDNGPGIPPEVLPHIFEAFFTTKPPGRGTGLGLALCREYVSRAGGTLHAENRPEGGARFVMRLPLVAQPPPGPS